MHGLLFIREILDSWAVWNKPKAEKLTGSDKKKFCSSISFRGYLPFIYGQKFDASARQHAWRNQDSGTGKS